MKTKYNRKIIGIFAIVGVIILVLIGYYFQWTGFNDGVSKVTITTEIQESAQKKVTRAEEHQPAKTLWDWLQLLGILAIPAVVGFGTIWFTTKQAQASEVENKDNQRAAALQGYIDKMSELLLDKELRGSAVNDEIRNIARIRTLTVLRALDTERKGSLLQFLHDCDLLSIIDLSEVDLKKANLRALVLLNANLSFAHLEEAELSFANLSNAILIGAKLSGANLHFADLSGANLEEAIVTSKQLRQAKSLRGAIVPEHLKIELAELL